jgi:hypothetical protein
MRGCGFTRDPAALGTDHDCNHAKATAARGGGIGRVLQTFASQAANWMSEIPEVTEGAFLDRFE